MKTQIIPQVKRIQVYETPIRLKDYYLSKEVTEVFPRAAEIFQENGGMDSSAKDAEPCAAKDASQGGTKGVSQDGTEKGVSQGGTGRFSPVRYVYSSMEDFSMPKEAYRISARKEAVTICASAPRGLMYALFTLSELDLVNDGELCEFDVWDEPALSYRALSDDISRGQVPRTEQFFTIIRRLARYKYNTYMPYIEDIFRFSSVPAWGRYSDSISPQEWRMIVGYAEEWNLSVRPIVNLLGHFDKLVRIRELQSLALRRKDGSLIDCMDPANPKVREVISDMLAELVNCFGKGIIHCGGDEPVGLTEVYGAQEGGRLFIEHYTFIHDVLKELGCSMMMYGDFFAPPWGDYSVPVERARELPEDTDFVFWDYAARDAYPFVDALHRQGIRLYISPGSWTWACFACDIRQCYDNTRGLLKADGGRSRGMIMSSWADHGDTLLELAPPGVLTGANYSWAPESDYSFETLYLLIHKSFYGFDREQAMRLDPIYHYDAYIDHEKKGEFKQEMWRNPLKMAKFEGCHDLEGFIGSMKEAEKAVEELEPARNRTAYHAMLLAVKRTRFTAEKLLLLPGRCPETIEEGIPYGEAALKLAGELIPIRDLHRRLWFETNRYADWEICAARYDDLYDQLRIFARNVRLRRFWEIRRSE